MPIRDGTACIVLKFCHFDTYVLALLFKKSCSFRLFCFLFCHMLDANSWPLFIHLSLKFVSVAAAKSNKLQTAFFSCNLFACNVSLFFWISLEHGQFCILRSKKDRF